jgi:hypothetical protein
MLNEYKKGEFVKDFKKFHMIELFGKIMKRNNTVNNKK